nr:DUF2281 domain-containing protein [Candidatus Sigynarchaeota archaeon]
MDSIEKKISRLPPELQREIGDFIEFLLQKEERSAQLSTSKEKAQKFPQPLLDEDRLTRLFPGQNIAICDGNIIAADPSLKNLHAMIKEKVPAGKTCHVRYIDAGVSFYGLDLQA